MRSLPAGFLTLLLAGGCVGPGLLGDGSSVSFGTTSTGLLRAGSILPPRGDGYIVPKRWRDRQRSHGTDEIVELLVRAARRVGYEHRNALLGVADLSPRGGGPSTEHRSHRSGRDADLILYQTDLSGKPVVPVEMVNFDDSGLSVQPTTLPASQPVEGPTPEPRQLDVERTWTLIKTLVTDPKVSVQWIFVGRPIARLLLLHAQRRGEPTWVMERAAAVMQHAHAHMDHMHVRVFCAPSDRALGCIDRGPPRWLKKEIKYTDSPHPEGPQGLIRLSMRQLRLIGL